MRGGWLEFDVHDCRKLLLVGCRWLSLVVVGCCCWLLLDAVSWRELLPVVVEEGL